MSAPLVSIVIPTLNGGTRLRLVLEAIGRQRAGFPVEIIVVDSGSTDGSAEWLAARPLTLVQIAPDAFNHGTTRNLGIERSRGEFVVLLVQDAAPTTDTWLTALVAPLQQEPRLAAHHVESRLQDERARASPGDLGCAFKVRVVVDNRRTDVQRLDCAASRRPPSRAHRR